MRGLGFAPGINPMPTYDFEPFDFSWTYGIPETQYWGDGTPGGGGVSNIIPQIPNVSVCFDDWTCKVVPILQQVIRRTGRPCFAEWYGEVKGLDQNQAPISLGSDGHNVQRAWQMLQEFARSGIIYAMWQDTIVRFNPDGTTVTVGRYDLENGTLTMSEGYQQSTGTYYPTIPDYPTVYQPQTGSMFGIDQNTLLLLAGGGLLVWALTRRK